jgi:pyrroloquinoline quinone biosynthesis protein D
MAPIRGEPFVQTTGFFVEEMDGEIMLYKTGTHKAVYLNETAALVWKLCDGERTVEEMAKLLREGFPNCGDLSRDVEKAIQSLLKEGAISARA